MPRSDLTGEYFGFLRAVSFDRSDRRDSYWLCECRCGGNIVAAKRNLRAGRTQSCGCLRRGRGAGR